MNPPPGVRALAWTVFLAAVGGAAWLGRDLGEVREPRHPEFVERGALFDTDTGRSARIVLCIGGSKVLYDPYEGLAFAAWDDGTFVWSADDDRAGSPLLRARKAPAEIAWLQSFLTADYAGLDPAWGLRGCGILEVVLTIDGDDAFLEIGTMDEVLKRDRSRPEDLGLVDEGERRDRLRDLEPEGHRRFLASFASLRARIEGFVPGSGEPCPDDSIAFGQRVPRSAAR